MVAHYTHIEVNFVALQRLPLIKAGELSRFSAAVVSDSNHYSMHQGAMPDPYLIVLKLLARLPWAAVQKLGAFVGWVLWHCSPKRGKVARINLAICFPDMPKNERIALAKRSLIEGGKTLAECSHIWLRDYEEVAARIDGHDAGILMEQLVAAKKPVLFATPHIGNWEVAGLFIGKHMPITSLYKPVDTELERVVKAARERTGATLAPADLRGVKAALGALRRSEAVGVLPDQCVHGDNGVMADLFGRPAMTMTLVNRLARKAGAELYMISAERKADGKSFYIRLEPAAPGIDSADEVAGATALNVSVERSIRACADQYWWSYERYRRQPWPEYRNPYKHLDQVPDA